MGYRKKISLLLLLSSIIPFLVTLLIKFCNETGYYSNIHYCKVYSLNFQIKDNIDTILEPLLLPSLSTLPLLFLLLFTKEAVYKSWKKFFLWFLPLAGFWIVLVPSHCGGGWIMGCLNREMAVWISSGFFLFISLLIIIIRSWQLADNPLGFLEGGKPLKVPDTFTKKTPIKLSDISVIVTAITEAESTQSKKKITETLLSQGFKKKDIEKAFEEIKKNKKNSVL